MVQTEGYLYFILGWGAFGAYVSYKGWEYGVTIFLLSYSVFASLIIIEVIYMNTLLYLYLANIPSMIKTDVIGTNIQRNRRRVNKTIIIISAVLVIAYAPMLLGYLYLSTRSLVEERAISMSEKNLLAWLCLPTVLNSGLNALIFMSRNTFFLNYFKSYFRSRPKH